MFKLTKFMQIMFAITNNFYYYFLSLDKVSTFYFIWNSRMRTIEFF